MNKQQIYDLLQKENIWHEITEHEAVFSMKEVPSIAIPYPESDAKNLFVRDKKKTNYYLITVRGDKRVDLKEMKNKLGTSTLSFASADELMSQMELLPGSVSPFGLLNNKEHNITLLLDEEFLKNNLIGIHPNENTATTWLKATDLINLITAHSNKVLTVKI